MLYSTRYPTESIIVKKVETILSAKRNAMFEGLGDKFWDTPENHFLSPSNEQRTQAHDYFVDTLDDIMDSFHFFVKYPNIDIEDLIRI